MIYRFGVVDLTHESSSEDEGEQLVGNSRRSAGSAALAARQAARGRLGSSPAAAAHTHSVQRLTCDDDGVSQLYGRSSNKRPRLSGPEALGTGRAALGAPAARSARGLIVDSGLQSSEHFAQGGSCSSSSGLLGAGLRGIRRVDRTPDRVDDSVDRSGDVILVRDMADVEDISAEEFRLSVFGPVRAVGTGGAAAAAAGTAAASGSGPLAAAAAAFARVAAAGAGPEDADEVLITATVGQVRWGGLRQEARAACVGPGD